MKMNFYNLVIFVTLLNLVSSISLAYAYKNPFYLFLLLLNIPVIIRAQWSRVLLLLLLYLSLIFILLNLAYSLIRIEEVQKLLTLAGSLLFSAGYVTYSLFIFSSHGARVIYQKKMRREESNSPGWTCPKCSSKMVFSVACWNCGFKNEDLNKPESTPASESDKIGSCLQKKKEEGEIRNA